MRTLLATLIVTSLLLVTAVVLADVPTSINYQGRLTDDQGDPVEGALVDIWQANSFGRYHHEKDLNTAPEDPDFQGWGMVKTDAEEFIEI